MSELERTLHRYRLRGSNITFWTGINLDELDLDKYPVHINNEDIQLVGVYDVRVAKVRKDGKEATVTAEDNNG